MKSIASDLDDRNKYLTFALNSYSPVLENEAHALLIVIWRYRALAIQYINFLILLLSRITYKKYRTGEANILSNLLRRWYWLVNGRNCCKLAKHVDFFLGATSILAAPYLEYR